MSSGKEGKESDRMIPYDESLLKPPEKCRNCEWFDVDDCTLLLEPEECSPEKIEEMKRLRRADER